MDYVAQMVPGYFASVRAERLCAPADMNIEHVREEYGFVDLEEAADEMTFAGLYIGTHVDPDASEPDLERVRSLSTLMGSIGEGLTLSVLAATEATFLRVWADVDPEAIPHGHLAPERFLWESAAQFLVGAGHRFTSLVLHLGVLDRSLPAAPKRVARHVEAVGATPLLSADPRAWPSESSGPTIGHWVMSSSHEAIRIAGKTLLRWTTDDAWRGLVALRGQEHHRWRPLTQSDGTQAGRSLVDETANATIGAIRSVGSALKALGPDLYGAVFAAAPESAGLEPAPTEAAYGEEAERMLSEAIRTEGAAWD